MATHSSIPAWKIAWTEETGELWFMGLQRVEQVTQQQQQPPPLTDAVFLEE